MSEFILNSIQMYWLRFRRFFHKHFMTTTSERVDAELYIFNNLTNNDRLLIDNLRDNKICLRCGDFFGERGPYLLRQRLCRNCVLSRSVFGNTLKKKKTAALQKKIF